MSESVAVSGPRAVTALAAQGLTATDVAANRAGRVSPAQLERLATMHRRGRLAVGFLLGGGAVASVAAAGVHYAQHGDAVIFTLPAIALLFLAALYVFVYRLNRLPSPEDLADAKVSVLRATVGGSLVAPNRGVYTVWLNGVRYSGCSSALSEDVRSKGRVVDAYVVADRKLVLALVPAD